MKFLIFLSILISTNIYADHNIEQVSAFNNNKLDKYFAYDIYYSLKTSEKKRSERVLFNILAYSKLCQFTKAEKLISSLNTDDEKTISKIKLAKEYIAIYKKLYPNSKKEKVIAKESMKSKHRWRLKKDLIAKLTSPKNLRTKVESLCL